MSEPNVQMTAFRLPMSLIRRIDRYARRMTDATGNKFTRADAVRSLMHQALLLEEKHHEKNNGKKR